jgi:L-iditol 2-dehydrogenase
VRAAVLRGPGDVVIEERPVPRPGPAEVVVRVRSVGVCGSDTHYYDHGRIGSFVVEAPLVLGHEAAGEVTELGPGVTRLTVGQRVSVEPGVPDLTCEQCLAGRYNLCPDMRFFATPPIDGAFAEYVVVHEAFAHPVPEIISDDAAALLEPLSVGIWACKKARVSAGDRVLITGAGPIGLVSVQAALAFGATEVIVSDVNPARLALAKDLGATEVVDARETTLSDLPRPPGVLLECSGHAPAISDAIRALDRAGRAVLVGMGGDEVPLPVSVVQERELQLTGTFRYAGTWPTAIALVASGRIDLDRLVTGTYRLDQAEDALTAGRRDQRTVKVVIRP